jgi:hypothetical protein
LTGLYILELRCVLAGIGETKKLLSRFAQRVVQFLHQTGQFRTFGIKPLKSFRTNNRSVPIGPEEMLSGVAGTQIDFTWEFNHNPIFHARSLTCRAKVTFLPI